MRFPEDRIKEAILDPDPEIRDRAVSYFGKSYSSDPSIMRLVIQSVETHGRETAWQQIGASRDLRQSDETIDWVLAELNAEPSDRYENYTFNLSMVLMEADPALLLPREAAILKSRHFLPDLRNGFIERMRMHSWGPAECWQKLEEFSEAQKDKKYINEANLPHAFRIVEALARYGPECEPRVRDVLTRKVEDYRHNPMGWLEPLAIRLAGRARLESSIPLIIARLLDDIGDLGNEQGAEALVRIGTPAVVEAVAEVFAGAEYHFRLYAAGALEHIHGDLAVARALELLDREKDPGIQINLAHALLSQFAPEGIEATRRLIAGGPLGFEGRGLRQYLLETATIMGERFPEYDQWLSEEKAEQEAHWKRMRELQGDPRGMMLYALEKLTGKEAPEAPPARPTPLPPRRPAPSRPPARQHVGRNDPCPCGSGKKFKNCCMRNQGG